MISRNDPESAAAHAGLQVGDVVLAFSDADIASTAELEQWVHLLPPGSTATLQVWRNRAQITLATLFVAPAADEKKRPEKSK